MEKKIITIKYTLAFILAPFSMLLNAQQQAMSLNECIQYAWSNNLNIKNAIIDKQIAKEDYTEAIGAFIPRASAMATVGKTSGKSFIDPITNLQTSEDFKEGYMQIGTTLSLFEGFTRINQLKLRKFTSEKREWEIEDKKNRLAFDIMNTYYKLLLERQLLTLAQQQSELSGKYLYQMQQFVELGLKSESELQEVKARQDGDKFLITSRGKECDLTLLQLKQLLNIPNSHPLSLIDVIDTKSVNPMLLPSSADLYEKSSVRLPSFKILALSRKEAEKELSISRALFSPKIYGEFSMQSKYKDTYYSRQQLSDNFSQYIGLGISIPISTGLSRITNIRKKKLNKQRIENEISRTQQLLFKEMEETLLSVNTSIDEHRQAKAQAEAENLVLKESERKWEEGLISVFQLLETRNRLINAKAELARVYFQYEINKRMLTYFETGSFIIIK